MKSVCFFFILCSFFLTVQARLKLPALVGDHMVLQQNTQIKLWGEAEPNTSVTVQTTWDNRKFSARVSGSGKWELSLPTPAATYQPQQLTLKNGKENLILRDILIGEVWLASGQSNMEMPLNGFWNSPVKGSNLTIATAQARPYIRMFTVARDTARKPQEDCEGEWQESTPVHIQWWSATAYHFAQTLQTALQIPIGIIHSSWGGTKIESWLPEEDLRTFDDVRLEDANDPAVGITSKPFLMYYGMIAPCRNYTIRGFIWYQGCSNVGTHRTYAQKMAALVKRFRTDWQSAELPFYYVEIAPYNYGEGIYGALLREAQFKAQQLIPYSGMVCTNDLVEETEKNNIHPGEKSKVGQRLAYWALSNTYGQEGISHAGPSYRSMQIENGKAYIHFDNADQGFWPWTDITGFEIAGKDRRFVPAKAIVDTGRKLVIVSSDSVPEPIAVRYCFKNFQEGNLTNHRGLPVYPFRTDQFDQ